MWELTPSDSENSLISLQLFPFLPQPLSPLQPCGFQLSLWSLAPTASLYPLLRPKETCHISVFGYRD